MNIKSSSLSLALAAMAAAPLSINALASVYGGSLSALLEEPRDQAVALLVVSYRNAPNEKHATGCYYLLCLVLAGPLASYCATYRQDSGLALESLLRLAREGRTDARQALRSILRAQYRKDQRQRAKEERFAESQPTTTKPAATPILKRQAESLKPKEAAAVELIKQGAQPSEIGPLTGTNRKAGEKTWQRTKKKF